jgi:hypothetical protein
MAIPSNDNRVTAKRAADAMSRLNRIEASLFGAPQVQGLMRRVDDIDQLLAAIVETVGLEAIQATIQARRENQQVEQSQAQKAAIEAAVAEGSLVIAPTVEVDCLLVVNQLGPDGQLKTPSPVAIPAKQMDADLLTKLLGQSAGFETELQNKDRLKVVEIYRDAPPRKS